MTKLRLVRGEILQLQGPETGIRYIWEKRTGHAPITEVDDRDVEKLLQWKAGCCGSTYRAFELVSE